MKKSAAIPDKMIIGKLTIILLQPLPDPFMFCLVFGFNTRIDEMNHLHPDSDD